LFRYSKFENIGSFWHIVIGVANIKVKIVF